jgi:hypothetical protein
LGWIIAVFATRVVSVLVSAVMQLRWGALGLYSVWDRGRWSLPAPWTARLMVERWGSSGGAAGGVERS